VIHTVCVDDYTSIIVYAGHVSNVIQHTSSLLWAVKHAVSILQLLASACAHLCHLHMSISNTRPHNIVNTALCECCDWRETLRGVFNLTGIDVCEISLTKLILLGFLLYGLNWSK